MFGAPGGVVLAGGMSGLRGRFARGHFDDKTSTDLIGDQQLASRIEREARLHEAPIDLTGKALRAVREERPSGAAPRRPLF